MTDPVPCPAGLTLKAVLRVPDEFDVSEDAEALGFGVPVRVSRRLREALLEVWSPCACESCEAKALNVARDRLQRMLKGLRAAIEGVVEDGLDAAFCLDVPGGSCGGRKVQPLEARLCHPAAPGAYLLITLQDERLEEAGARSRHGGAAPVPAQ